jgi:YggT family protein
MPTCVQSLLSWAADTRGGRKERAVFAGLLGIVLLLFELVLIARMVVDWVGVLSPVDGRGGLYRARRITHGITEPVIGPVRRVLRPVRLGSVSLDLAFTAVFVAVIVLRTVVVPLIPF